MSNNEDKIALVTGGGKGIGKACCTLLSQEGFQIGIHYNSSKSQAEELASSLGNAFCIQGDISTIEGIDEIYNEIKAKGGNLAVLVNNAGLVFDNPIFSASLEEFEKTINTNLRGTWYLTKRLSRFMIRKKFGRIINITSVVGHTGNPSQSIYGMTKAALDNFTKVAAMEFAAYNILVNSVAPGFIDTDMTKEIPEKFKEELNKKIPLGRIGKPEEVAEVVAFLATSGNYCTGSIFHVNGGMYGG